jgi:hypothetical protein
MYGGGTFALIRQGNPISVPVNYKKQPQGVPAVFFVY